MDERKTEQEASEAERLKQLAAQMQEAEYRGLSQEEIQERKRQKELRKKRNIEILEDTLAVLEKGSYTADGQRIDLRFTPEQMREARVLLPEELAMLRAEASKVGASETGPPPERAQTSAQSVCTLGCENADALDLAWTRYQSLRQSGEAAPRILVLNLASATHPGGQTRKGASAQEEDLCRRTSLLLSLESEAAKRYYEYGQAQKTRMGSDAVVLSPCVEVLKDSTAALLPEPFPISVMSCAAPMVRLGLEGMSQEEYEQMLYRRIQGMLLAAASQSYRHLILGAFGCGIYGNDAAVVSDLFDRAIREFSYGGTRSEQLFGSIDFAVLCRSGQDYNYREFSRNFARGQTCR